MLVRKEPVPESQEQQRRERQDLQHLLIQLVVVERRLPVIVVQCQRLHEVNADQEDQCAREQNRNADAESHRDKNDVEYGGVLVVDLVVRPGIEIDVALQRRLPRC